MERSGGGGAGGDRKSAPCLEPAGLRSLEQAGVGKYRGSAFFVSHLSGVCCFLRNPW